MSTISNKPLDAVGEDDLQSLVDDGVFECKATEYKMILPSFSNPKDKKEFLADVSSFANASGGDLVYGIKEEKGIPVDLCGIDIPDTEIDKLKRQIEGIIRLNIGPRIQGILIQSIKLKNGRYAIIIRVPRSWMSPHMVILELRDHERFFSRTSSGKYPLDVSELRAAFMLSETMTERVRNFRLDRIGKILSDETPVPLVSNPKIILHVIPVNAFDPAKTLDISSLRTIGAKITPIGLGIDGTRYNLDGYLEYCKHDSTAAIGYIQLFRNGIIEVVNAEMIDTDGKGIAAIYFEKELHEILPRYISAQKDMGLNPPILVALSLLGVRDYAIIVPSQWHPRSDQKMDRDIVLLPESLIEDFEFDLDGVLKPILDALWNASGFVRSPHFDPGSGKWIEIN